MILGRLRAIGGGIIDVGHRVLDTAQNGLPQHRERVFIVGIRKRNLKRQGVAAFRWPRPVSCRPLARLLDPLPVGSDVREAERNFLATCSPGVVAVDMDGAKAHWMRNVSPCLTRNRATVGFHLPARGRRMTLSERFKLHGKPSR